MGSEASTFLDSDFSILIAQIAENLAKVESQNSLRETYQITNLNGIENYPLLYFTAFKVVSTVHAAPALAQTLFTLITVSNIKNDTNHSRLHSRPRPANEPCLTQST